MCAAPFFAALADGPPDGRAFWLRANDGVRIRAGYWPGGDKGTVLLLPGRSEYIEKYGRAARDLAARGYATLCVDFRGQGLADRLLADPIKGHVTDFADYQRDLQAVLALTRDMDCPAPLFILAHSMGGSIGLRALIGGFPARAVAFSAPMWGIRVHPAVRPFAAPVLRIVRALGGGEGYAPTTGPVPYVRHVGFAGNLLTTDRAMWDYMVAHLVAEPGLALGGPTVSWLVQALDDCGALALLPSPDLPAYCALGTAEHVVDVAAINARMRCWRGAQFDIMPGAAHEVMMEVPETRKRFFDAACALFEAQL